MPIANAIDQHALPRPGLLLVIRVIIEILVISAILVMHVLVVLIVIIFKHSNSNNCNHIVLSLGLGNERHFLYAYHEGQLARFGRLELRGSVRVTGKPL